MPARTKLEASMGRARKRTKDMIFLLDGRAAEAMRGNRF
jgi:hypothetical protein